MPTFRAQLPLYLATFVAVAVLMTAPTHAAITLLPDPLPATWDGPYKIPITYVGSGRESDAFAVVGTNPGAKVCVGPVQQIEEECIPFDITTDGEAGLMLVPLVEGADDAQNVPPPGDYVITEYPPAFGGPFMHAGGLAIDVKGFSFNEDSDPSCAIPDLYKWGIEASPPGVSFLPPTLTTDADSGDVTLAFEVTVPHLHNAFTWQIGFDPFDGVGINTGSCTSNGNNPLLWDLRYDAGNVFRDDGDGGDWTLTSGATDTDCHDPSSLTYTQAYSSDADNVFACDGVTSVDGTSEIVYAGAYYATAIRPADPTEATAPYVSYQYSSPFRVTVSKTLQVSSSVIADATADFAVASMYTEQEKVDGTTNYQIVFEIIEVPGGSPATGFIAFEHDGIDVTSTMAIAGGKYTSELQVSDNFDGEWRFSTGSGLVFLVDVQMSAVAQFDRDLGLTLDVSLDKPDATYTSADDYVEATISVKENIDVVLTLDDVTICFGAGELSCDEHGCTGGCINAPASQSVQLVSDGSVVGAAPFKAEDISLDTTTTPNSPVLTFPAYPLTTRTHTYSLHVQATVSLPEEGGAKRGVPRTITLDTVVGPREVDMTGGRSVSHLTMFNIFGVAQKSVGAPAGHAAGSDEPSQGATAGGMSTGMVLAAVALAVNSLGVAVYVFRKRRRSSHL